MIGQLGWKGWWGVLGRISKNTKLRSLDLTFKFGNKANLIAEKTQKEKDRKFKATYSVHLYFRSSFSNFRSRSACNSF